MNNNPLTLEFVISVCDEMEPCDQTAELIFKAKSLANNYQFSAIYWGDWMFELQKLSNGKATDGFHLPSVAVKTCQDFLDLCRLLNVGLKL